MKRLTAILLSALLVLSLAACGNGSRNDRMETSAGTQPAASAAESEAKEENNGENNTEGMGDTEGAGEDTEIGTEAQDVAAAGGSNILVAYFSAMETDGVDTVSGASRVAVDGEVLGNNQYIARIIGRETGDDLFSIETVQEYPTTHDPLLEFAYQEKADHARPQLATQIENPDSYDVIFLGFPNIEQGFESVLCA